MNKNINESIKFLINEYNRLKNKKRDKKITEEEKQTLYKLSNFLGKEKNKK